MTQETFTVKWERNGIGGYVTAACRAEVEEIKHDLLIVGPVKIRVIRTICEC